MKQNEEKQLEQFVESLYNVEDLKKIQDITDLSIDETLHALFSCLYFVTELDQIRVTAFEEIGYKKVGLKKEAALAAGLASGLVVDSNVSPVILDYASKSDADTISFSVSDLPSEHHQIVDVHNYFGVDKDFSDSLRALYDGIDEEEDLNQIWDLYATLEGKELELGLFMFGRYLGFAIGENIIETQENA